MLTNTDYKNMEDYKRFKLQWLLDHGYTLDRIAYTVMGIVHQHYAENNLDCTNKDILDEIEEMGWGNGSECYPCYEEWKQNEGR